MKWQPLIIALILLCGTVSAATPLINLTSKEVLVPYSGNIAITSGPPNLGPGATATNMTFYSAYNPSQIRQTGSITKFSAFYSYTGSITDYTVEIWRQNLNSGGGAWNRTGSYNITSQLPTNNTIIDASIGTIPVIEGDFVMLHMNGTKYAAYSQKIAGATVKYYRPYITSTYNWSTALNLGNNYVATKTFGLSPVVVGIGDSIMAGHPLHYSYAENSTKPQNTTNQIMYHLSQFESGISYQNMGMGSQNTTDMKNRFENDVINLSPNVVIIEGGVNDIAGGTIDEAEYLSNIGFMVNESVSHDISPVVVAVAPWTAGSTEEMLLRDNWTRCMKSNVSVWGGYWVDVDSYVGQNRAAGPAGNLWDINISCSALDGVHFNEEGYKQIAMAIADKIDAINSPVFASYTPSSNPATTGSTITFTDTSTGNTMVSWDWGWGDGTANGTTQNPTHVYSLPGTYPTFLNVTNEYGVYNSTIGSQIVANLSGFTEADLELEPAYTLALHIVDADDNVAIPTSTLTSSTGETNTTINGVGTLTFPYSIGTVYIASEGYQSRAVSYLMDRDRDETVQLPKSSDVGQNANTIWSPFAVAIQVIDGNMNPIIGVPIRLTAYDSSLPGGLSGAIGYFQDTYGVNNATAAAMLSSSTTYSGTTDDYGFISTQVVSVIQYRIVTQDTNGVQVERLLWPHGSYYQINTGNATTPGLAMIAENRNTMFTQYNASFWEPNSSYGCMGVRAYDSEGGMAHVYAWWKLVDNGTIWWTNTTVAGGYGPVNSTKCVPIVPYQQWKWGGITD